MSTKLTTVLRLDVECKWSTGAVKKKKLRHFASSWQWKSSLCTWPVEPYDSLSGKQIRDDEVCLHDHLAEGQVSAHGVWIRCPLTDEEEFYLFSWVTLQLHPTHTSTLSWHRATLKSQVYYLLSTLSEDRFNPWMDLLTVTKHGF